MHKAWRVFFLSLIVPVSAFAAPKFAPGQIPEITNLKIIESTLKVTRFKGKKFKRLIKLAVFDNGFGGYESELGKGLPKEDHYHDGDPSAADPSTSVHGTAMAILINKLILASGAKADYEIHLFNVQGYTKLAGAVRDVIADRFDIVLYSQIWEYGGNGDTDGFINALIDQAANANMLWINAAGDLGQLTRIQPIKDNGHGFVKFTSPSGKTEAGAKLICHPSKAAKTCNVAVELTWNDAKDRPDLGTNKDLDFYMYDSKGKEFARSEKTQVLVVPQSGEPTHYSKLPREEILTGSERADHTVIPALAAGTYLLKAKIKSHNFGAGDHLRITVTPQGAPNGSIELAEPTMDENLLPPADDPNAIVIGASDDPLNTNRSVLRGIPLVSFPGMLTFKKGEPLMGSSQSAALAAAITLLEIGTGTDADQETVTAKLKKLSDQLAVELSRAARGTSPSGGGARHTTRSAVAPALQRRNCMIPVQVPEYPALAQFLATHRATPIYNHGQLVLAYQGNFARETGIYPLDEDSRVFMTRRGAMSLPIDDGLPADAYRIVNTPLPPCEE